MPKLITLLLCTVFCAACGPSEEQPVEQEATSQPAPAAQQKPAPESDNIHTEKISYSADGVTLQGYLAYDLSKGGERPGVLVVHEWWGQNDYARRRARMLAEMGYAALAVDMYGDGKTTDHPKDANSFMMEVLNNMSVGEARFRAAYDLLAAQDVTDPAKIAAIGYCFGGAVVLHMARIGMDLEGVASFHGSLGTQKPAKPGAVKAKLLVLNGDDDPLVTADEVTAFKEEMANAKADLEFIGYAGALHSFTNPAATDIGQKFELPLAYNEQADKQSWAALVQFLEKVFSD